VSITRPLCPVGGTRRCRVIGVTVTVCRLCLKYDGTRAETRFRLSPKRTSTFKSAGASVQSTAGSRGVLINGSNAGYATFRGSVRVLATHSIRQFPLHFPSRASPCAITFQLDCTTESSDVFPLSCHVIASSPLNPCMSVCTV
jgi:hypothetical protein